MDKIPFTTYDVFGYLASGLALLAGLQLAFGFPPVLNSELRTLDAVFLLLAAYVLGHVVAAASQFVLESIVIEKGLGRPIDNLFRSDKPPGIRRTTRRSGSSLSNLRPRFALTPPCRAVCCLTHFVSR